MVDWIRPAGTIPGTNIIIYESGGPAPGVIWLVPHDIAYGSTNSWSLQKREVGVKGGTSYNTIAGDPKIPLDVREGASSLVAPAAWNVSAKYRQDDLPSKPTRPSGSGTEGLGAEGWRERQEREAEEFRSAQERAEKKQKYNGVRGYRAAVMGPQVERKFGSKVDTLAKWSTLWKRIPAATWHSKGNRTWLENGKHMLPHDPLRAVGSKEFQPWIAESCVPWLILEGTRLGLLFSTRPYDFENPDAVPGRYEESPATSLIKLVARYRSDRQGFESSFGECKVVAERTKGLLLANKVLGLSRTAAIGMNPLQLFNVFRLAMKQATDKSEVYAAYHRILLHKFLHRRMLVPKLSNDSVAHATVRRAWLLQAHRLLVFNSSGCPVSFNQEVLEENGIRKLNNASLVFKNKVDLNLVDEWTRWLYGTVLEMPMETCARSVSEFKGQVSALAEMGHLS